VKFRFIRLILVTIDRVTVNELETHIPSLMQKLLHSEITGKIISAFYKVYNTLGYGFSEKVYENSLFIELSKMGCLAEQQFRILVYYEGQVVGKYSADLIVERRVIIELKAISATIESHEAQLLNYLRATNIEVGLLLNFGPKPEYRRKFFTNDRKGLLECLLEEDG